MDQNNQPVPPVGANALQQIGESEWMRRETVHRFPYPALSDEAFSELQESLIASDQDYMLEAIGTPRRGQGGNAYFGFDTEGVADKHGKTYRLTCYQWYAVVPGGEYARIFYTASGDRDDRLCLKEMINEMTTRMLTLGLLIDVPERVIICAFFSRFDLGGLADFRLFKNDLDNIGGALVTLKGDLDFEFANDDEPDPDADGSSQLKNQMHFLSIAGECYRLPIRVMDMGKHAQQGDRLADIGEWIKCPKETIDAPFSIERFDQYLAGDRAAAERYSRRDAEIPVKLCITLEKLVFTELLPAQNPAKDQGRVLPSTISALGISVFRRTFPTEAAFDEAFGLEDVQYISRDRKTGRTMVRSHKAPTARREMFEAFITRCYSGGRNESYMCGATDVGVVNDFDLKSAYTMAMVDYVQPDNKLPRLTTNPGDYVGHVLGFAHIRFTYPDDTRYPGLPVQSVERGLYFPLSGESYCGAPEIEVALNQGCHITILEGVVFDWKPGATRLFEPFVAQNLARRNTAKSLGDNASQLYYKLLGNTLYGKAAQGLKPKMVFDAGSEKSVELPKSAISHPAIAGHVTSLVRATLAELLHGIPPHHIAISATTDGFLSTASLREIKLGPMAERYQALCSRINPADDSMLELKHRALQVINMRTRGQLTAMTDWSMPASKRIILAKSGETTTTNVKPYANEEMVERYLNRQPAQKSPRRSFTSLREQVTKDVDVIMNERDVTMNLEYDMKRRPVNPRWVFCRGQRVLTFDTMPWRTASDAEFARAVFDDWRTKRCLKSLDDFDDWSDYYLCKLTLKQQKERGIKMPWQVTQTGSIGILVRMFLRAYFQEAWGLQKTLKYRDVANTLVALGWPADPNTVRNGSKGVLLDNAVPRTPRTEGFLVKLHAVFPSLDCGRVFFEITP